MRVKEYVRKFDVRQVTFIKARARQDAYSPFCHYEYQTTPTYSMTDAIPEALYEYIVLNDDAHPIDWICGCNLENAKKSGWLTCLLVISDKDFDAVYGP